MGVMGRRVMVAAWLVASAAHAEEPPPETAPTDPAPAASANALPASAPTPEAPPAPPAAPAPPAKRVRVVFHAVGDPVAVGLKPLHELGSGLSDCTTPCERSVPPGTYRVSVDDIQADDSVRLERDETLTVTPSRPNLNPTLAWIGV